MAGTNIPTTAITLVGKKAQEQANRELQLENWRERRDEKKKKRKEQGGKNKKCTFKSSSLSHLLTGLQVLPISQRRSLRISSSALVPVHLFVSVLLLATCMPSIVCIYSSGSTPVLNHIKNEN